MIMPETLTLAQVEALRASMPTTTQTIDEMIQEAKDKGAKDVRIQEE
jgi:hypothetical protein